MQASVNELQVWHSKFDFETKQPVFFQKLAPVKVSDMKFKTNTDCLHALKIWLGKLFTKGANNSEAHLGELVSSKSFSVGVNKNKTS